MVEDCVCVCVVYEVMSEVEIVEIICIIILVFFGFIIELMIVFGFCDKFV